jgi:2,3-dihydroxybiphenyl 1,2-dioxygenase
VRVLDGLQLGYLVIGAEQLDSLDKTFTDVLGLQRCERESDHTAYRMDEWDRRFVLIRGANELRAVGLVARDDMTYESLLYRLTQAGVALRDGTTEECAIRAVKRLTAFHDPAGNPIELAVSPARARAGAFTSRLVPTGFLTGSQGLGHAVLMVDDLTPNVEFYEHALGFAVSDTSEEQTAQGPSRAVFLHCNRRHHTVALVRRPAHADPQRRLAHFMIQAQDFDAVGLAFDRALDAGLPIFRSLGRHPNDGVFSFYFRTPANFDIEFGAGATEVDEDWQVMHYQQISAWGHRPLV